MSKWYTAFDNCSLEEFIRLIKAREMYWFVKRLSGNDTNLTKSHQSGIYVPYTFMKIFIPEICTTKKLNPTVTIDESLIINYSQLIINVKAKYYNNKFFPERGTKKLYNEYRFTSWGGKKCALRTLITLEVFYFLLGLKIMKNTEYCVGSQQIIKKKK